MPYLYRYEGKEAGLWSVGNGPHGWGRQGGSRLAKLGHVCSWEGVAKAYASELPLLCPLSASSSVFALTIGLGSSVAPWFLCFSGPSSVPIGGISVSPLLGVLPPGCPPRGVPGGGSLPSLAARRGRPRNQTIRRRGARCRAAAAAGCAPCAPACVDPSVIHPCVGIPIMNVRPVGLPC